MILGNDTATLVDKNPALCTKHLDFLLEDTGINEHATADAEFSFLVYETGRDHANAIFVVTDLDSVSGIRTHTAAGDDYGFILIGNMGNNFALTLIPKKSTNDDCTAH
jgi:hypothetical protein